MLDAIDKEILSFLQNDSKITTKELSVHLGLSSTAIYERVRKMERKGVIEAYSIRLNKEMVDLSFVVFCQIKLKEHKHQYVVQFEKEVIKFAEVLECYNVSGDYDYLLKIMVKDMPHYHQFLNDKLTYLDHIGSAHSTFIINEVKNTHAIEFQ
ncbi:Lrp/AsnC family transcriptional regulator [Lutimonas sp.]|uniref:Lrp/AsnC family transcriptional regulator n=1 Tax=Lutimonas sp. TaxID=1872403 RepID=UPI003D9BA29D